MLPSAAVLALAASYCVPGMSEEGDGGKNEVYGGSVQHAVARTLAAFSISTVFNQDNRGDRREQHERGQDGDREQEPRGPFQVIESSETRGKWWGIVQYNRLYYSGGKSLVLMPEKVRLSSRGDAGNSSLPDHTFGQPVEVTLSLADGNEGRALLKHRDLEEYCREEVSLVLPPLTNLTDRQREWVLQPGEIFDVLTIFRHTAHREQPLLGKRDVTLTLGDHTVEIPTDLRDALPVRRILPGVPENGFLVSPHLEENLRCVRCPVEPGSVIWVRFAYTPEGVGEERGENTLLLRQCGKSGDVIAEFREVLSRANEWYDAIIHVEEGTSEVHCLFQSTFPSGFRMDYLTAEILHKSGKERP